MYLIDKCMYCLCEIIGNGPKQWVVNPTPFTSFMFPYWCNFLQVIGERKS